MTSTVKVQDTKSGKMVDGQVIRVVRADEPFSHLELEDGTTITMRTNVVQIVRHLNSWDDKGNPVYSIEANGSITITCPDNLRKAPEDDG